MKASRSGVMAVLLVACLAPMTALSQKGDWHTDRVLDYGLAMATPSTANVSLSDKWIVHLFERDGISYYQVNDLAGRVHVIVARMDDAFFTLPAGDSPASVSLPLQRLEIRDGLQRTEVYRGAGFSIAVYGQGKDAVWSVSVSE